MAEPLVISALVAKRSELAGEIAAVEAQVAALRADLAHVDATLALFGYGRDPETIPPTHRQAPRMFKLGELTRLVLDACRRNPALATAIGVHDTERNIANKISQGGFTAVFLLQTLTAIGTKTLDIKVD